MSHSIVCHNSLAKLVFPLLLILAGIINTSQASEGFDNSTALLFKGYAVFHAEKQTPNGLISQKFCVVDIIWNIEPLDRTFPLVDHSSHRLCKSKPISGDSARAYYIFRFDSAECPLPLQLLNFESLFPNAIGLIFATSCDVNYDTYLNITSSTAGKPYSIALLSLNDTNQLAKYQTVTLRRVEIAKPLSLVLFIFGLAVLTIIIGSWWSGLVRKEFYDRDRWLEIGDKVSPSDFAQEEEEPVTSNESRVDTLQKKKNEDVEPAYIQMSICSVLILVTFMVSSLMLLYLFYDYFVFIIIFIFLLASAVGIFNGVSTLAFWALPKSITGVCCEFLKFWKRRQPPQEDQALKKTEYIRIRLFYLPIIVLSIAIPTAWFIIRFQPEGWIIQDILGIGFCINMLRTIRLPNFKICLLIFVCLFFYDIFFVFATPLFTSKGKSIMVEVATGGSSGDDDGSLPLAGCPTRQVEMLPMLLKVPQSLFSSTKQVCTERYSMLGFGDILVPGMLVSYCNAFDRIRGNGRMLYYWTSVVSYAFGLFFTYLGMYFMNGIAQPALLYLVPSVVLPVVVIGLVRGELRQFYAGPEVTLTTTLCEENPQNDGGEAAGNQMIDIK